MEYKDISMMCKEIINFLDKSFSQYNSSCDNITYQLGFALIIYDVVNKRPVNMISPESPKGVITVMLKLLASFMEDSIETQCIELRGGEQEETN